MDPEQLKLVFLADHPEAVPFIARWYFDEWGYLGAGSSADEVADKVRVYLNKDKFPLIILALEGAEPAGIVQLKYREMDIYPEKEHWLGGVYVAAEHRGKGLAAKIINKALNVAKSLDVTTLHLQTQNLEGGLYKHLGWAPVEQVNYHGLDVLVMERTV
jgi:GNAT superfamily N-acetyltransferase